MAETLSTRQEVIPVDGAESAYVQLFDAEFPRVRRTIRAMVGSAATAEDITQDAFVQLLVHWRKVSRYERPDAWVRRVAIRLAVRHLKRESRRQLIEGTSGGDRTSEPRDLDLRNAIAALPPRQRAVLVLFYYEDLPMKEIARTLRIAESTGFVHLHRARRALELALGGDRDVVREQNHR